MNAFIDYFNFYLFPYLGLESRETVVVADSEPVDNSSTVSFLQVSHAFHTFPNFVQFRVKVNLVK